jgi:ubiquinone/menaquinone biosynthesis C-methylase UbiE
VEALTQRGQYAKGGIGKWFRDFRDDKVFSLLGKNWQRIIDLGCGEGIILEKLVKGNPDKSCLGIDLTWESLKTSRHYHLPVICGDISELGLKSESVDHCLLLDVIEHIDQPEKVLEEVLRILKPKGSLIVVFPNDAMFFLARLLFLKFKEAFYDPGHVQQFRPKKMEALLKAKGFRVDRLMHLPFFIWPISLYHLIQVRKEPGDVAKPKRSEG